MSRNFVLFLAALVFGGFAAWAFVQFKGGAGEAPELPPAGVVDEPVPGEGYFPPAPDDSAAAAAGADSLPSAGEEEGR